MNKYRIVMLSAGDINAASSRLRCFFLADQLARLGADVAINRAVEQADILFVQKRISKDVLDYAIRVKTDGGLIVFDIDDYGPGLQWLKTDPTVERQFLGLCDVLLVDTETRLKVFSEDPNYAHISEKRVLPDPIDYLPWLSHKATASRAGVAPRGAWFGNAINLAPAIPYIQHLVVNGAVSGFDAITGKGHLLQLAQQFPALGYRPWELQTFAETLQGYDFVALIHDSNLEGVQKSNNKMLATLALGVIPFVSNTPAYSKTAEEIGLPELIIETPQQLLEKVSSRELLSSLRARLRQSECTAYLREFMPDKVAATFDALMTRLLRVRRAVA